MTHIIVRAVWFVFIGIWLAPLALLLAWLLNVTIVGLPLGIKIINRAPYIASLKESGTDVELHPEQRDQHPIVVRAVYFVLVGWWLSLAWTAAAAAFTVSIIGYPIAAWFFRTLPLVTSLYRT